LHFLPLPCPPARQRRGKRQGQQHAAFFAHHHARREQRRTHVVTREALPLSSRICQPVRASTVVVVLPPGPPSMPTTLAVRFTAMHGCPALVLPRPPARPPLNGRACGRRPRKGTRQLQPGRPRPLPYTSPDVHEAIGIAAPTAMCVHGMPGAIKRHPPAPVRCRVMTCLPLCVHPHAYIGRQ
jgi:hypothetical protein